MSKFKVRIIVIKNPSPNYILNFKDLNYMNNLILFEGLNLYIIYVFPYSLYINP